ncbi:16S rRNA (guanine(527)-N(7))-methyltransferase RsmG [Poseidonocella sedimentorum]|uniref:Ribosomal RNA small subunit methyltransferase G n=1 Tax=Poseidonocella sedimentorum TaxID=871652 RepID=A0A1I6D6G5_9RHOB|nr:16S rRNA (guanine(527)-N(7))-methyltransferase RsmG [Poseidonocella sedimentorum]SFR01055.1 16S rRNA m(7)G-527 methyltransferase [Poseidonocella sedimentorum]
MEMQNVSRETEALFRSFESLVGKWSPRINLVSKSDLSNVYSRHIIDSKQVYQVDWNWSSWIDIGSGGGFPGIVVAILAKEFNPGGKVVLVESDKRKCAFLRTAIRELDLPAQALGQRIEDVPSQPFDIVSARALAPLGALFGLSERFLHEATTLGFPKGKKWQEEIELASRQWLFDYEAVQSKTDPESRILIIRNLRPIEDK